MDLRLRLTDKGTVVEWNELVALLATLAWEVLQVLLEVLMLLRNLNGLLLVMHRQVAHLLLDLLLGLLLDLNGLLLDLSLLVLGLLLAGNQRVFFLLDWCAHLSVVLTSLSWEMTHLFLHGFFLVMSVSLLCLLDRMVVLQQRVLALLGDWLAVTLAWLCNTLNKGVSLLVFGTITLAWLGSTLNNLGTVTLAWLSNTLSLDSLDSLKKGTLCWRGVGTITLAWLCNTLNSLGTITLTRLCNTLNKGVGLLVLGTITLAWLCNTLNRLDTVTLAWL